LGVKIQDVTDEIAESLGLAKASGALVAEVTPTGPAEKAGIKSGDIILAFDNKPVREMRHLPRIVAETDIDRDVVVIVWRDGKRMTLTANIGELEKAEDEGLLTAHDGDNDNILDGQDEEDEGVELSSMGIRVTPLDDTGREIYNIGDDVKGLLVIDADLDSDAGKKGIDVGDVITDINQKPVRAVKQAQDEILRAQKTGRESVLLLLNRQGSIQFVAVKLQADDAE
jgi:serine protease Do